MHVLQRVNGALTTISMQHYFKRETQST